MVKIFEKLDSFVLLKNYERWGERQTQNNEKDTSVGRATQVVN